ncbi:uncharacterized protein LOC129719856 [Wyeomyia smithii]|uniref:uncharacterized protein LOC129719856 n=1 Tax=Wyeomyia smithii TaxID=174621 RepID=UPI002467E23A|nr:uncharacterized protein LOC129719856 [Wyeomyia smithii]
MQIEMSGDEIRRMPLCIFNENVDSQDLRREWEEWHRAFELYLEMRKIESQHEKYVTMLSLGGRGLQRIFHNLRKVIPVPERFPLMPPEIPEYDNAVKRLEKFFIGKRNERVELEVFRSLTQGSEETFNNFILRLRSQASRCEFLDREETELLQQITMGAKDEKVKDKGLENVMTLDEVINYAVNREILMKQREKLKPFRGEPEVNSVSQGQRRNRHASPIRNFETPTRRRVLSGNRSRIQCDRCGSSRHIKDSRECFDRSAICNRCGQRGHYARKCTINTAQQQRSRFPRRTVERYSDELNSLARSETTWKEEVPHRPTADDVAEVNMRAHVSSDGLILCQIDNVPIEFLIDSGASINTVTEDAWNKLLQGKASIFKKKYQCDRRLHAYASNAPLDVSAVFEAWIYVNSSNPKTYAEFYVV